MLEKAVRWLGIAAAIVAVLVAGAVVVAEVVQGRGAVVEIGTLTTSILIACGFVAIGGICLNLPSVVRYFADPQRGLARLERALPAWCLAAAVSVLLYLKLRVGDPARFSDVEILTLTATGLFAALLLLPRILRINLAVFLVAIALMEGAFHVVNGNGGSANVMIAHASDGTDRYRVPDPITGWDRPRPGLSFDIVHLMGEDTIYDVRYTIDERRWRVVPGQQGSEKQMFVAFFGCSLTFGEGVNDDETMPFYFAQASEHYKAYNFGLHGWGPQHMLGILESDEVDLGVSERRGIALFTYIPHHMQRLVGNFDVSSSWGRDFPHYELDEQGTPVTHGNFTEDRPLLTRIFKLLSMSSTVNFIGRDRLDFLTEDDYDLMAAVFAQSCKRFEEKFESEGCYVVFHPSSKDSAPKLIPYLDEVGVSYLDYTSLWDLEASEYRIPGDGHPTPLAHRTIGERLAQDLDPESGDGVAPENAIGEVSAISGR